MFYFPFTLNVDQVIELNVEESRHLTKTLRKRSGDIVDITNGQGTKAQGIIVDDSFKKSKLRIVTVALLLPKTNTLTLAVSLLKAEDRWEWLLEKACELGVDHIQPLICHRTESSKFRHERYEKIVIAATKQSLRSFKPSLSEPLSVSHWIQNVAYQNKLIAHCIDTQNRIEVNSISMSPGKSAILIGPEGDFTFDEIQTALEQGFKAITLGNNRLRTETAAIKAVAILCDKIEQET